jgi:pimeloyl-ACP methyl ester carboxylesterase
LLHGLFMRRPALLPIAGRLRRRGFTPAFFIYPTVWQSPELAMERLAERVRAIAADAAAAGAAGGALPTPAANAAAKVDLLAHSLGGLMVLETLNRFADLPIGRVVCLGSPIAGSAAARGLERRGLGWLSGKSGDFLRRGLMQVPPAGEIGMIAGTRSLGLGRLFGDFDGDNDGTVAVSETRLPGLTEHLLVPSSHSGLIFSAQVAEFAANFLETGRFQPT